jgi:hypothetical protein
LCLRATTDYWVNAMDGQPFFVVNQVVDPGLIQVVEQEIVPRLEQRLPIRADQEALAADPLLSCFRWNRNFPCLVIVVNQAWE